MWNEIKKIKSYLISIPSDKYLHCLVSLLLTILFTAVFGVIVGCILVALIGIAKEYIIDLYLKNTKADIQDIYADGIGIILGALITLI